MKSIGRCSSRTAVICPLVALIIISGICSCWIVRSEHTNDDFIFALSGREEGEFDGCRHWARVTSEWQLVKS